MILAPGQISMPAQNTPPWLIAIIVMVITAGIIVGIIAALYGSLWG
jgi:hypothetical protein